MKLSAPLYRLKRQAKVLSRQEKLPLHKALDQIAMNEGYNSWSALVAKVPIQNPACKILNHLHLGDLVLLAARPGQGKTLMGLEILHEAIKLGKKGFFFTLEYTAGDVLNAFQSLNIDVTDIDSHFEFDDSNDINADYMIEKLERAPNGAVVVIDYLQLLDQKRENPDLNTQIQSLKSFAKHNDIIVVIISQIDRRFDQSMKPVPSLADVRLPNPLDLSLFNKTCFLNNGEIQFDQAA